MKTYYKAPVDSIMIVKTDGDDHEIYLIKPVLIGHTTKIGDRKVSVGRHVFSTIKDAVTYLLESRGEAALANKMQVWHQTAATIKVSGLNLVKTGAWMQYCAQHKIAEVDFLAEPTKTYSLTPKDAKKWGLDKLDE